MVNRLPGELIVFTFSRRVHAAAKRGTGLGGAACRVGSTAAEMVLTWRSMASPDVFNQAAGLAVGETWVKRQGLAFAPVDLVGEDVLQMG